MTPVPTMRAMLAIPSHKAAIVFAAEQCERALRHGDTKGAAMWSRLAFAAVNDGP